MTRTGPSPSERRSALLRTARRVVGEAGPDAGVLLEPVLAVEVAAALAADVAAAVDRRAGDAATLDELVEGLVAAVLEGAEPWRDAMGLAHLALERAPDFERWAAIVAPWLDAVERAIRAGQRRRIVCPDVEPAATALVLRDVLDRTARVALRFERDGYRDAATALVRAALSTPRT